MKVFISILVLLQLSAMSEGQSFGNIFGRPGQHQGGFGTPFQHSHSSNTQAFGSSQSTGFQSNLFGQRPGAQQSFQQQTPFGSSQFQSNIGRNPGLSSNINTPFGSSQQSHGFRPNQGFHSSNSFQQQNPFNSQFGQQGISHGRPQGFLQQGFNTAQGLLGSLGRR